MCHQFFELKKVENHQSNDCGPQCACWYSRQHKHKPKQFLKILLYFFSMSDPFMGVRRGGQEGALAPPPHLAGQNSVFGLEIVCFKAFFRQIVCFLNVLYNRIISITVICRKEQISESISSTFYESVFRTKCWHQNLQSCVLGLKFWGQKFHTKNARI